MSAQSNKARIGSHKLQLRSLGKSFGTVKAVDGVNIDLAEGELLALLGPSGCGKTTTLRMVAGLEQPTVGDIVLDGEVLANASMSLEPEKRKLGMVFQTYALWPHMNVFENVAYGLRRSRYPVAEIRKRVSEVLEIVGMAGYANRPSTQLSGGQQQRVAVARSLATRPKLLLFDEPLSNLDAVLRESMRFEIRSLQQSQGITAIYVTHSQDEALSIADVVGVMKDGHLQQLGPPEEVYRYPRNRFVAGFVGLANLLTAVIEQVDAHRVAARFKNGMACTIERRPGTGDFVPGTSASIAVRPENIRFNGEQSSDSAAITVEGKVVGTTFSGNLIDYFVDTGEFGGTLRVQTFPPVVAGPGSPIRLQIASTSLVLLEE